MIHKPLDIRGVEFLCHQLSSRASVHMAYDINLLMLAGLAYAGIIVIWTLLWPETSRQEASNLTPTEPRAAPDASLTDAGPQTSRRTNSLPMISGSTTSGREASGRLALLPELARLEPLCNHRVMAYFLK